MAADDLSTLSGFAFRFRAGTGFTGPGDEVINYGSAWTDDAGNNALAPAAGGEKYPCSSVRSGMQLVTPTRANTGAQLCNLIKTAGTSLNCAGMGVVMIGRNAGGTDGGKRNICTVGTSAGGGEVQPGINAAGLLTVGASADANLRTSTLRMPAHLTMAAWQVSTAAGGSSWMKILGQPAWTGAGIAATANNAWLRLMHDGGGNGRWTGGVRELVFFNSAAAVSGQIDLIEAYVRENLGILPPSDGTVICAGDSYGVGAYMWHTDQCWPGEVAAALPRWAVVNNCRSGWKIADLYTNRALVFEAAGDYPLPIKKPGAFIIDAGKNDIIQDRSLVQMQTDALQLANYLRGLKPTWPVYWHTQMPTGILTGAGITAKEVVRLGFNDWLRTSSELRGLDVRVIDVAAVDGFVPAGTSQGQIEAVVLGTNYTINTTTPSTTNDRTHLGPAGLLALAPLIRGAAVQMAADLLGGRASLRYGRTAELGVAGDRLERWVMN